MDTDDDENSWIGICRVPYKAGDVPCKTVSTISDSSIGNDVSSRIVTHLMKCSPIVLGRVLSTQDPIKATASKYIASLSTPGGGLDSVWSSPRKKSDLSSATKQKKNPPPRSQSNNHQVAPLFRMEDILTKDDDVFLRDIMVDFGEGKWYKGLGCVLPVVTSTDQAQDLWKNNLVPKTSEKDDRLQWLVLEIEREWKAFVVTKQGLGFSDLDRYAIKHGSSRLFGEARSDHSHPGATFGYKASLLIAGRKCDLGTYSTVGQAAVAYNHGVIARRTIAMKVMEESDIRKIVLSRKASYMEMKRSVLVRGLSPHESSSFADTASLRAFNNPKPTASWISKDVLRPEVNFVGISSGAEKSPPSTPPLPALGYPCPVPRDSNTTTSALLKELDDLVSKEVPEFDRYETVCRSLRFGEKNDNNIGRDIDLDGAIGLLEARLAVLSETIALKSRELMQALRSKTYESDLEEL